MEEKDVIDAVLKMHPTVYKYKGLITDNTDHFGFIAQELEEIFPRDKYGVVVMDRDSGYLKVNYHEIIPLLCKVIQVQEERINKLEKIVECEK